MWLTFEASCMIVIYMATLAFVIYNIVQYLIKQKRYKNWLITVFYFFSFLVLSFRICYYGVVIDYYWEIQEKKELWDQNFLAIQEKRFGDLVEITYSDMLQTTRMIGVFFLSADYTKFALGFF